MGLAQYELKDFSGGLNTQDGPFNLESNEAQDLLNVTLSQRGELQQRLGSTRFDASGIAAVFVQHMRPWYFGSTRLLMVSADGDVYSGSTAGAFTSRIAVASAGVWCMEQMTDSAGADFLWCCNGLDAPQKLSTALAQTAWTDATGTGNVVAATKMNRVWKNRMVICNGDTAATLLDASRLRFSDITNPSSFPDNNFQDIRSAEDDVDPITWMEVLGDILVVFKKQSVWAVTGEVPNLIARRIGTPGCEDRFQSCVSEGRVYFWSRTGIWSTDGIGAPRYETRKIENLLSDNLNHSEHNTVRMYAGRDRRVFAAVQFGSATDGNTRLVELLTGFTIQDQGGLTGAEAEDVRDIRHPIVLHDLQCGALCTFRPGDVDVIVGAFGDGPGIHTIFSGTDDEMVLSPPDAIAAHWHSAWFPIQEQEPFERLRRVNVLGAGSAVLEVFKDFQEAPAFSGSLNTGVESDPLWGGGVWDGVTWDPGPATALSRTRPETRARYHSVRVSNDNLEETFRVLAIEFRYRGGKEH